MRKPIPKKKTKSISKLKQKLDQIFSIYIRQKYANKKGEVSCYTCGKTAHWKEMQNGHFVSRSSLSTRWLEDNCRVQCTGCNVFGSGRIAVFANRLESESISTVELYKFSQQIVKMSARDYETKIEYYKKLISKLNL